MTYFLFSALSMAGRKELALCVLSQNRMILAANCPTESAEMQKRLLQCNARPALRDQQQTQLYSAALVRVKLYYFWSLTLLMAL